MTITRTVGRWTSVTVLVLAAVTFPLVPPATAFESCRGLPVTHVGIRAQEVVGSEGPDVIVTGRARAVRALGGDDTICVTDRTRVDAGPGNDLVDATGNTTRRSFVTLGDGEDTFVGGSADDTVDSAGTFSTAGPTPPDLSLDVIATGAGSDEVRSGSINQVNGDRLDTGADDDTVFLDGVPAAGFDLDLGEGSNAVRVLLVTEAALRLALGNLGAFQPQPGETVVGWSGVASSVNLYGGPAPGGSLRFQGTDANEDVLLIPSSPDVTLSVDLGGGDDTLGDHSSHRNPGSTFSGGRGQDELGVNPYDDLGDGWAFDQVWVDLERHRLDYDQPLASPDVTLAGIEHVTAGGPSVTIRGNGSRNELVSFGCTTLLVGRVESDVLRAPGDKIFCGSHTASLRGGRGHDRMTAGNGDDFLDGGLGRDRANGRKGTDTCRAEVRLDCERF